MVECSEGYVSTSEHAPSDIFNTAVICFTRSILPVSCNSLKWTGHGNYDITPSLFVESLRKNYPSYPAWSLPGIYGFDDVKEKVFKHPRPV